MNNNIRCFFCGVALALASVHCPVHGILFAVHCGEGLRQPPYMPRFEMREPEKHTDGAAEGSTKPLRAAYTDIATSSGSVTITPGTGTLTFRA